MPSPPSPDIILVIDDDPDFVEGIRLTLERAGYTVLGAGNLPDARQMLQEHCIDLLLVDESLGRESGVRFLSEIRAIESGLPSVVISGHADLEMALKAMRAGAIDMLPKPFGGEELVDTVQRNLADSEIVRMVRRNRWYAARHAEMGGIIGQSPALCKLVETIRRVAPTDSTVLIQGESGVGKELVARAVHMASPRRHREMVAENFGSLSQTLLESTLFGSRRGAYTGADSDRPGLFEIAHGSTLFLDEIGESTPEVQVRLLRVLEERTVTRMGDSKPRQVDVRLIAATNRDLKHESDSGRFRADLYYRLNVIRLQIPPLRDRAEDIEPIAKHLLSELNRRQKRKIKGLDRSAIQKLQRHHWPGNVRELRNVIEFGVITADSDWITAEDLVLDRDSVTHSKFDPMLELTYRDAMSEFDRRYFRRLIQRANGNKSRAAELAGIDRTNIYKHLEKANSEE
jgi:DNA-binding NtrC family response regulator